MTYHSNFEVLCGKPVDGAPQFCEGCPIKSLKDYNPQKFLAVILGMERFGPFLDDDPGRQLSGHNREAAKQIIQEDGEFKDSKVAELAVVALERHLDGSCQEEGE